MDIQQLYQYFNKCNKVVIDSRKIEKDDIFFAFRGEHVDGNLYAEEAIKKGALLAVVDNEFYKKNEEQYFLVEDVPDALQQLAAYHRKQLQMPFLAITGSNGKTTTKELINAVLSKKYNAYATVGNLNNYIGVPLTILSIKENINFAIVEMGANHQGEIAALCNIARPDYGLITNIGKAHLEGFGGIEGVKKGKGELFDFIRNNGSTAFVYADSPDLEDLSSGISNKVTYGTSLNADCYGSIEAGFPFLTVKISLKTGAEITINTQIAGGYNLPNILAAACVGDYFGVAPKAIKEAIESYTPANNRSQVINKNGNTYILDAYNANPTSMKAAIENLDELKDKNKVLILGEMLELGNESVQEHAEILDIIKNKEYKQVFLVGEEFKKADKSKEFFHFKNAEELKEWLKKHSLSSSFILIKGSRRNSLEKLLD